LAQTETIRCTMQASMRSNIEALWASVRFELMEHSINDPTKGERII
jgi:hypothetical protein